MLLSELFTELREDFLEDTVSDEYKWSDPKLLRYFNEAIQEACYRAPLYTGTQTITVAAEDADYTLNAEVRQLDRVMLALVDDPLMQYSEEELINKYGVGWRTDTGTPYAYVRKDLTITLYPEPIVADTLTVTHYRLPDRHYSQSEEPPIPEEHHRHLLYWAAYKAYINPDIDLGNPERAFAFLAQFENHFGKRKSARQEHLNLNTPKHHRIIPVRMA
jgi:hypothetical protein